MTASFVVRYPDWQSFSAPPRGICQIDAKCRRHMAENSCRRMRASSHDLSYLSLPQTKLSAASVLPVPL
jgi:hypothetical protein